MAGEECPVVCPHMGMGAICDDGIMPCDNGIDHNGCWMGNWCPMAGEECPVVCPPMEGVVCENGKMPCDNGMDDNGCWMGNWCPMAGEECPPISISQFF